MAEKKAKRLTFFGRVLLVAVVVSMLVVLGEMVYTSFRMKEFADNNLVINNQLNNGFRISHKKHHAGLLESYGTFDVVHQDLCSKEDYSIGTFYYRVQHIPFSPDVLYAELRPSKEIERSIVREKDPATGELKPLLLFTGNGDLNEDGTIVLQYRVPALRWVDARSGKFYNLQSIEGHLSQGLSGIKVDGVLLNLDLSFDNDNVKFESVSFNQTFTPKADVAWSFNLTANKIKSEDVFVRGFDFGIKGSLKDNVLVLDGVASANLFSHKGNPLENIRATFDSNVNDFVSFLKIRKLLSATCGGKVLDEENRVDLRLNTTRVVDRGISARLSGITWTGPRGAVVGKGVLSVKKVIDMKTGLPDFHDGLSFSAQLTMDKLYKGMPLLEPLFNAGLVAEKGDKYDSRIEFSSRKLVVNGQGHFKDDKIQNEINSTISSWAPLIGKPLTIGEVEQ